MPCPFKVGDIVVALKDAPYNITKAGWKGKVVEIIEDSHIGMIVVESLNNKNDRASYPVHSTFFIRAPYVAKNKRSFYNSKLP